MSSSKHFIKNAVDCFYAKHPFGKSGGDTTEGLKQKGKKGWPPCVILKQASSNEFKGTRNNCSLVQLEF